jgi:hypothetical protein
VQGKCTRGKVCPYRHENISKEEMDEMAKKKGAEESIRDRFHGVNDPIA